MGGSGYMHTWAILQVQFYITIIKQVSQWSKSHQFSGIHEKYLEMENLKKNSGTKRLSLAKKQTNKQTHNDTLKSTEDKQEGKFTKLEDMSKEVN